jgi:hypothetical protein
MKIYIQRIGQGYRETVAEFGPATPPENTAMAAFKARKECRQEALRCLGEYQLSDSSGRYYLSSRPCKAWLE